MTTTAHPPVTELHADDLRWEPFTEAAQPAPGWNITDLLLECESYRTLALTAIDQFAALTHRHRTLQDRYGHLLTELRALHRSSAPREAP